MSRGNKQFACILTIAPIAVRENTNAKLFIETQPDDPIQLRLKERIKYSS